jgi:hypothetical protein
VQAEYDTQHATNVCFEVPTAVLPLCRALPFFLHSLILSFVRSILVSFSQDPSGLAMRGRLVLLLQGLHGNVLCISICTASVLPNSGKVSTQAA